jgi:hypothetical protein
MIRVYCKEGESVGGIAVKEHLGKSKKKESKNYFCFLFYY